ncbi:pyocin activator PrtN family protein [Veronia pacifica]|uniref:Pyocin activator protein PrtN n=1 Tax=Veronia pacifica TaxID=1080227 RepID=A0A1C3ESL3_9GAMM|nr:pyocin activator PrtN family protein [Veronia pacifica]ODA36250.1 hypothetical protein A8L45_01225 [Veronia pacifica]
MINPPCGFFFYQYLIIIKTTIPLKDICEKFFGLTKNTVEIKAKAQTLPVPTFKMRGSNRSPELIHVDDLAKFRDVQLEEGRKALVSVNSTAA